MLGQCEEALREIIKAEMAFETITTINEFATKAVPDCDPLQLQAGFQAEADEKLQAKQVGRTDRPSPWPHLGPHQPLPRTRPCFVLRIARRLQPFSGHPLSGLPRSYRAPATSGSRLTPTPASWPSWCKV